MKRVLVHWVEMRTYEVPDDCPTDEVDEFYEWIRENESELPVEEWGDSAYVQSRDSRDLEIVDVEQL